MRKYVLLSILTIFIIISLVLYGIKVYAPEYRFSVVMTGNAIMAGLSILTYIIVTKQMNERPEAFVRGVYGATFLKLMVCMASILLYVMLNRKNIHKPSLFMLFGIYAVYTGIETWLLSKLAKGPK